MDIIFKYTEEQAVEDGELIHPYPEQFPWLLLSINVHVACQPTRKCERSYDQKLRPLIADVIHLLEKGNNKEKLADGEFLKLKDTVADTVWISMNGKGGLTIMQPNEL